ncbi:MAG: hypothetical protein ACOCY0_00790 [Roseicyclus sp.]
MTVTNESGGVIVTQRFQSDGIMTPAFGGSGGAAGNRGGLVAIGGDGGSGGAGDTVTVSN